MPDPYERHGRPGQWDYADSQPSRSQARKAAAEEPQGKRPPAKKNPDLCKARHWQPHVTELRTENYGWRRYQECGWSVSYTGKEHWWSCRHHEACASCGKDFGKIPLRRCPLYHDITPEEQQRLDAELAVHEERRAKWKPRLKPVITGPQGYRKKRI